MLSPPTARYTDTSNTEHTPTPTCRPSSPVQSATYMHVSTPQRQWTVGVACWLISTSPSLCLLLPPCNHLCIPPSIPPLLCEGQQLQRSTIWAAVWAADCLQLACVFVCVRVCVCHSSLFWLLACPTCFSATTDQTPSTPGRQGQAAG